MPEDVLDAEQTVAAPPPAPPAPPASPVSAAYRKTPEQHLYEMAEKYRVDPQLALAILTRESGGRQTGPDGQVLQSGQGAQGFFQLLPKTAYGEFQLDPRDPFQNIEAGVRYLRQGMDRGDGTIRSVASYYHGGPNRQLWGPITGQYAQGIEDDLRQRLAAQPTGPAGSPQPQPDTAQPVALPSSPDAPPTPPARTIGPHGEWAGYYPLPPPKPIPQGFDERYPAAAKLAGMVTDDPIPAGTPEGEARFQRAGVGTTKFLHEATTSLDPRNIAKGVGALFTTTETPTEKTLTLDPRPALRAMWDANAKLRDEGRQLMDQARTSHDFGKSLEGLGRIAEGMVPVFGPRLAEADKWARGGEYARAAGAAVDVAGQVAGPSYLEDSRVTPRLFKPRLTPAEQAAVDLGMRTKDLPMDVATASGSTYARATQRATEATPLGGVVHEVVKSGRQRALPALGDELASGVHPVPVTPEQSGAGIRAGVEDYIAQKHQTANTSYDTLRQIEQDPALAQSVQVGTRQDYHPSGDGTLIDVPVMETMPLPAAVGTAKPTLQALYDRVMQSMPLAQQEASPGLTALKQVLQGPDYVPASVLDRNLSAIKDLARGADMPQLRDVSQGLAAKAVAELEKVHADAIQRAGPAAQQALATGRAATKAKWAAQEVLDKVTRGGEEPVRAFNAATVAGDAAIEHLRDLQRLAPTEIPKMGRAILESLFDRAGGLEKGWGRADSVANRWAALGPETKRILYGNRAADLDSFFLLSKMLARNPNPSGSALVALAAGSGWGLATHPLVAAPTILGSGAMAALMNTRFGVRLLTQGLTIPAGGVQAAAWATAVGEQLRKMRQDIGLPPPTLPGLSAPAVGVAQPPPAPPR